LTSCIAAVNCTFLWAAMSNRHDREVYIAGLGCGRIEKSRPIDLSVGMRPDLLDRAARIAEE